MRSLVPFPSRPEQIHPFSIQTMRDHRTLSVRITTHGPRFREVREQLLGKSKCHLSEFAAYFAAKHAIPLMDRLERRTFDGIVTWFCKYSVLKLLDPDDERKLNPIRPITPKLTDIFEDNSVFLDCEVENLFAHRNDIRPGMGNMNDDMKANEFPMDF
jgi:hypothetical protein